MNTTTRILIVGTGFSGLGLAMRLKASGVEDFLLIEKAQDVGGTWRENTYPGAACDVKSHLYSFSFAPKSNWSRVFSAQPEIEQYLRDCADSYNIRQFIRFGEEMKSARYDESKCEWTITSANGNSFTAQFLVLATGPLHLPNIPDIKGLENFEGPKFHSAKWNHQFELKHKKVAVIGTGASAIQFVPEIQKQVDQLFLFQRSAPWVIPKPDGAIAPWQQQLYEKIPLIREWYRQLIYWMNEVQVLGFTSQRGFLRFAEKLVRRHLKRRIKDKVLLEKLLPNYEMGCKRILLSNNYYPALQQPNVEVITDKILSVGNHYIESADGQKRNIDAIIFGTGFHVTDAFQFADITGRNATPLKEVWKNGAEAFLGTTVHGFPNMFMLIGPNTGLGHNSMVYMIEAQIHLIMGIFRQMQRQSNHSVEVKHDVQDRFNRMLDKKSIGTVWNSGCNSWYLNQQGRSAAVWPDFTFKFRAATEKIRSEDYIWN
ncbi:MAG: NAD(P)/FAD-dependent oxidoreductase [Chitinophagales bacterium]